MFLGFFEFIGTSEMMLVLVVALILFGPRKLPQISRQIGKGLAEFKKASEDFRQTWEKEVTREFSMQDSEVGRAMLPPESTVTENSIGRGQLDQGSTGPTPETTDFSTAIIEPDAVKAETEKPATGDVVKPTRKRDWL